MEQKLYTCYCITNTLLDKKYVGITGLPVHKRFRLHLSCAGKKSNDMYQDMLYQPESDFVLTVLEENIPEDLRDVTEQQYIEFLDTFNNGYNRCKGGQGTLGYVSTPERNERLRVVNTGRYFPDEWKKKLSDFAKTRVGEKNPFYGKTHSEEMKQHFRLVKCKYPVDCFTMDGTPVRGFNSANDAGRWIIECGRSDAKLDTVSNLIRRCCKQVSGYQSAYGYIWKFNQEQGQSTNFRVGDELPSEAVSDQFMQEDKLVDDIVS